MTTNDMSIHWLWPYAAVAAVLVAAVLVAVIAIFRGRRRPPRDGMPVYILTTTSIPSMHRICSICGDCWGGSPWRRWWRRWPSARFLSPDRRMWTVTRNAPAVATSCCASTCQVRRSPMTGRSSKHIWNW